MLITHGGCTRNQYSVCCFGRDLCFNEKEGVIGQAGGYGVFWRRGKENVRIKVNGGFATPKWI